MATETVSTSSTRTISTVKTKITPTRAPDAHRSRLLNRIGIFNAPNSVAPNPAIERKMKIIRAMGLGGVIPPKPQTRDATSSIDTENIRSKIDLSKVTHEPLKYKEFEPASKSSKANVSAEQQSDKKDKKSKITFNDDVSVAHIPMRCEYSDRVRSRLWSNRYEIHENATRNAIEFQAEGWDWRSVTEDEGMFVCTSSGELIHPVHCQQ